MKKSVALFAFAALLSSPAFATYWVVLRDGTKYKAKARPGIANGKALVSLENGQILQLDANLIDFAASDRQTKLGLGDASVIAEAQPTVAPVKKPEVSALGSSIKLRKPPTQAPAATPSPAPASEQTSVVPLPASGGAMSSEVIDKFERAFENIGIFEHKVSSPGAHLIHADVTADTEEKVFNAISATAFLMVRNAGVQGAQIDTVELFMGTTTGGSAGRFRMSRDDAQAIDNKTMTREDYFVKKVLF